MPKSSERGPIPRDRLYPTHATAEERREFSAIVDAYRESERAESERAAARAICEHLVGRFAIYFPLGDDQLDVWAAILDRPEDVPAQALEVGGEHTDPHTMFESAGNRLVNEAESAGRIWRSDHALSGRHDDDAPLVLFLEISAAATQLLDPSHLARFPGLVVFDAGVGLPITELSRRFHAVGLNLDDFEPALPATAWTAELCEAMTDQTTETEDDMTDTALEGEVEPERNAPLDFRRLRTEERRTVEYLEPGVIPRGRYMGLSGEAGAGKSVLVRDFCTHWPQGRSALDPAHRFDPVEVVYFDWENGPDWWVDGLDKSEAPMDLPGLRVICYPELDGGLDTERGARSFLQLVESLGEIDVIVIDTVGRTVEGSENDADTWHNFYRRSILPLRRVGITVVRLDHTGKNAEQGARGSSAKMSDLDAHYILTATAKGSNSLALKLDKRRQADYDESVRIQRRDNPLTHTRIPDGKLHLPTVVSDDGREMPEDEKVAALVAELDRLNIAAGLSRRVQQTDYVEKAGTVKASTQAWSAAVSFRIERIDRELGQ